MSPPSSIIFEGLNDSQQQAITTTEGALLVVAGPGTGKTLTIVRRIAWLVHKGVRPENILAVTFTNRAAREMKERTSALLGDTASKIFIGTFHLLGLRIIRENRAADLTLYGRDEQSELLKSLMKGTSKAVQQAAEKISRIKNFLDVSLDDLPQPLLGKEGSLRSAPSQGEDRQVGSSGEIKEVYESYQAALAQKNAFDFDDLIRVPIELLQDDSSGRRGRTGSRTLSSTNTRTSIPPSTACCGF